MNENENGGLDEIYRRAKKITEELLPQKSKPMYDMTVKKSCGVFSCLFPWMRRKKDRSQHVRVEIADENEGKIIAESVIEDILYEVSKQTTERRDFRFDSLEDLNLHTLFGSGDFLDCDSSSMSRTSKQEEGGLQQSTLRETVTFYSLETGEKAQCPSRISFDSRVDSIETLNLQTLFGCGDILDCELYSLETGEEAQCPSGSGECLSCYGSSAFVRNVHEDDELFDTTQTKYSLESEEEGLCVSGIEECKNSCDSSGIKMKSDETDQITFYAPLNFQNDFEIVHTLVKITVMITILTFLK